MGPESVRQVLRSLAAKWPTFEVEDEAKWIYELRHVDPRDASTVTAEWAALAPPSSGRFFAACQSAARVRVRQPRKASNEPTDTKLSAEDKLRGKAWIEQLKAQIKP